MRRREFSLLALMGLGGVAHAQSSGGFQDSGLVGNLEAPNILSTTARPAQLKEAPMLAELVRAGKLPPVAERLPQDVMVIEPLRSVGKYGGTWRRAFIGPSDSENGNRIMSADKPLFFDVTGTKVMPCLCKDYEVSEDGKRTTLHLRRGLRWSDGSPHTADDWLFWFNDLYANKDIVPAPAPELSAGGKPGKMIKVDDYTVAFEFESPYFLFPFMLAGDTLVGGGSTRLQSEGRTYALYAPAAYLKQFLPQNSSVEELTRQARAAGFNNWVEFFKFKSDWRLNRDLPVLSAWRMTQPINTPLWALERNPYYYGVDTEGQQLPYIDRIQMTLAENPEVVNLRAIAGEYDHQERFIDLGKLPVLLENQERSNYRVHLDTGFNGSDTALYPTLTYTEDAEIGDLLRKVEFRRALALGIDRDQLNEAFWLGLGTPGSSIPEDSMPESPGGEWRTRWSTHNVAEANKLLDSIGLDKKDREGFRLRRDNGQRLRIEIAVGQTLSPTWPQQAEMIVQHWRDIGIAGDVKVMERGLWYTRAYNDQHQIGMWTNNGTESLYLFPRYALPVDPLGGVISNVYAAWYASNGAQGRPPEDPELRRAMELLRSAGAQQQEQRNETAKEIWRIVVEQQFSIGTVGMSPAFMGVRLVSNRLENVAGRACISQHCRTPWSVHPEQWFFKS